MKIIHEDKEIEVYTAEEVTARETTAAAAAVKAKETEFAPIKTDLETRLGEANKALGERTGEFKQFRKLSDETKAKLTVAERTIYENQELMAKKDEERVAAEAKAHEARVDATIRAKAGSDEKLFTRMKEMWGIIGINATAPEEMEKKTLMILGALKTTEPDIVAQVMGASGGGWAPPAAKQDGEKSFADSERGALGAAELGLVTKPPEKK